MTTRKSSSRTAVWVAALVVLAATAASGAPLRGEVVTFRQPDGTTVDLRVWGDEFYAVGETMDGYTVVRDENTGLMSYAVLSADGTSLVSTGVPAGEAVPGRDLEKHVRISEEAAREKALAVREAFELEFGQPPGRYHATT